VTRNDEGLAMTEAELWQIQLMASSNGLTAIGLLLTLISGYLVTAYFVGSRLSVYQRTIISFLFILGAGLCATISLVQIWRAFDFLDRLARQFGEHRILPYAYVSGLGVLLVSMIPASLLFMFQIRRNPSTGK
jgi:ABC-type multidrug transport system permease subunit